MPRSFQLSGARRTGLRSVDRRPDAQLDLRSGATTRIGSAGAEFGRRFEAIVSRGWALARAGSATTPPSFLFHVVMSSSRASIRRSKVGTFSDRGYRRETIGVSGDVVAGVGAISRQWRQRPLRRSSSPSAVPDEWRGGASGEIADGIADAATAAAHTVRRSAGT